MIFEYIFYFTNFLSNHDTSRSVSRWGDENIFREESAKTHALMLFVLKGIPCIYYGEEIGLLNTHFEKRSQFRDVDIFNGFASLVDKEKIYSEDEFFKYMNINSRDAGRSLMQWDSSTNAGFNLSKTPWLKTGRRSSKINVEKALKDRDSIFYFYQKLIKIRKKEFHDVLIYGTSECQVLDNGLVMIKRSYKNEAIIAYLNLTSKEIKAQFHNNFQLLSSYKDKKIVKSVFRPFESILIKKQL